MKCASSVPPKSNMNLQSAVCQAIQACHAAIHAMGVPRIATDVRIGTRTDRVCVSGEVNKGKVIRVERILEETAK